MPKIQKHIKHNHIEGKGVFIDTAETDASTETKWKTVFGELIDVIQFAIMTAFDEGVDTIARYAYGIKQYLSNTTIAGLDTFSILIMLWLASIRVDKYKQRHEFFEDKNSLTYYSIESDALIKAMTEEEKLQLLIDGKACHHEMLTVNIRNDQDRIDGYKLYIQDLLKHNAKALDATPPHTKAKKIIMQSQLLFERVRKRPIYVMTKYESLIEILGLNGTQQLQLQDEAPTAKSIMYTKISQELNLTLDAAENLISELTLIEKHWKHTIGLYEKNPEKVFWAFISKQWHTVQQKPYIDKEFNHEERLDLHIKRLLSQHSLQTPDDLDALKHYYQIFHKADYLHDQNDQNFYKANERGILAYEHERTQTKVRVFSWVRRMSMVATPLSILLFIAVWINPVAAIASFIPLFMVGSTSLMDEAVDIRYKYQKWKQSVAAMKAWKKDNPFSFEINGKPIDILDKIKVLIEARDQVPSALSAYSGQELIFLDAISLKDSDQLKPTEPQLQNIRYHLPKDLEKAFALFKDPKNASLVSEFIKKSRTPLPYDAEFIKYIEAHEKEINEFRFYAEGYVIGSDSKESREPRLYAAGMRYLESQYKINQQYENRVARRQTKLVQSSFSFNGVFWGVLASMAVHVLLLSAAILTAPMAMSAFNYIGFITIAIAAVASGIMIKYQLNQNKVKGQQKTEEHYLQMNYIITPSTPGAPSARGTIDVAHAPHVTQKSLLRFSQYPSLAPKSKEVIHAEILAAAQAQKKSDELKNPQSILQKVRNAVNL